MKDKQKPKELEWVERLKLVKLVVDEDYDEFVTNIGSSLSDRNLKRLVDFIKQTLTQQRSELLEEILNLECLKEESGEFDQFWLANQLRKEIIDEIKKL